MYLIILFRINPKSMQQIKWIERKFDFSYQQNIFPSIKYLTKNYAVFE